MGTSKKRERQSHNDGASASSKKRKNTAATTSHANKRPGVDVSDGPVRTTTKKFPRRVNISEAVKNQKKSIADLKETKRSSAKLSKPKHPKDVEAHSKYVGLDCEMVGVGRDGKRSVLARACVVDYDGNTLYDAFCEVKERVVDFRTQYSGVRPSNLKKGKAQTREKCIEQVAMLLKDKILVGHALHNDLKVLQLSHPRRMIRDTSSYRPFMRRLQNGKFRPRKLKEISKQFLDMEIQGGEHTPDEDAKAAMMLYRKMQREWESGLKIFRGSHSSKAVRQLA